MWAAEIEALRAICIMLIIISSSLLCVKLQKHRKILGLHCHCLVKLKNMQEGAAAPDLR